jgi:hypothetical protein
VQASAQAESGGPTSALGQAAYNVLRTAIDSGYDGISSTTRALVPVSCCRSSS